jgi:hypothetical protein
LLTAPIERQGVPFDGKIGLLADRGNVLKRQAEMNFNDPMALRTGQVMVVDTSTDTIVMGPIGEFDTIEQVRLNEHFNRAVDRGSSQMGLALAQVVPEIVYGKICPAGCQLFHSLGNQVARVCLALTLFRKDGSDLFGKVGVFALHHVYLHILSCLLG